MILKIPSSHSMRLKRKLVKNVYIETVMDLKIPTSHSMRCPFLTLPILKAPKWEGDFYPPLQIRRIWGGTGRGFFPPNGIRTRDLSLDRNGVLSRSAEFGDD